MCGRCFDDDSNAKHYEGNSRNGGYNSCGSFNSTWCYYTYAYIRSSSEYRGCCREFRCANSSTWNNSSRNSHTGNNKCEWFEYKMWQWCFDNLVFYGDDYHVLR